MMEWLKQAQQGLMDQISKFKNHDFMESVVAGCALVAAADGTITSDERQKMFKFIQNSDELKVFKTEDIMASWRKIIDKFAFDSQIGKAEALKVIGRIKGNPEAARLMIRVCCIIGAEDGNFDDDEKYIVVQICRELGINPAEFDLPVTTRPISQVRETSTTRKAKPMTVSLTKGGNISLTKTDPDLKRVHIGLGWDPRTTDGAQFDLDASAFLLKNGKARSDTDFIFYNQLKSVDGSVQHTGDNRDGAGEGDDESLKIDLALVPTEIDRIPFTVTIYEASARGQNFGQVQSAFIRIVNDETNNEIVRYDLSEDASVETAMIFGELYRSGAEWKFKAIGQGFQGGLAALCHEFGVTA